MREAIIDNNRILIIDDDRDIWQTFRDILEPKKAEPGSLASDLLSVVSNDETANAGDTSFRLSFADQGQDGYELVRQAVADKTPYAVAFIDIRMPPGWNGMETAARMRRIDPALEIVIVTAFSDLSQKEIVGEVGHPDKLLFLRKPFDAEEITQLALSLTSKWNLAMAEKRQRTFLNAILDASPAAIVTIDNSCRILSWSRAAEEITGYSADEMINQPCILRKVAKQEKCQEFCKQQFAANDEHEVEIITRAGETKIIALTARKIEEQLEKEYRVVSFWDITSRKELEQQQRQSQKMEALGTLAGGVAHDLNNMLTPIYGYVQLAKIKFSDNDLLCDYLQFIDASAKRAAELIRQILAFSRKQMIAPETIDLNKLILDFSKMLQRLIREDIDLQFHLSTNLWSMICDPGQMEQVIINLIVNARDAASFHGGEIVVSTANVTVEERLLDVEGDVICGDFVLLQVRDNGIGMNPTTASRVFDPFYTTKGTGQGTGMGLSTVLGIVKKHNGYVRLETSENAGTAFFIYFPRSEAVQDGNEAGGESTPLKGGNESILLAEDSSGVRELAEVTLTALGYKVHAVDNGAAALQSLQEKSGSYDLLLSDVIMPGLNGKDLARKAREMQPDLPVLLMTGYGFEVDLDEVSDLGRVMLLTKPFSLEEISTAVRDLLSIPQGES